MELPRLVRGKPHAWDPHLCMHWGDTFLQYLKGNVPNQPDTSQAHTVWRVKFTPGVGVALRQLDQPDVAEVEAGEPRIGFLPDWYLDALQGPTASTPL